MGREYREAYWNVQVEDLIIQVFRMSSKELCSVWVELLCEMTRYVPGQGRLMMSYRMRQAELRSKLYHLRVVRRKKGIQD